LVNPLAITARAVLIGCFRAMCPAVSPVPCVQQLAFNRIVSAIRIYIVFCKYHTPMRRSNSTRPVAGGGVLEAVACWRSLAGGASCRFPPRIYIYIYNRSKMRHALPWLSLAGGAFWVLKAAACWRTLAGGALQVQQRGAKNGGATRFLGGKWPELRFFPNTGFF